MARTQDIKKQVESESIIERARREWVKSRILQIHRNVSAYEVLQRRGVGLLTTAEREEQFSCPFHGADRKPSARIYPESARGPSHVWCYVCQERWDAISLWRKFNGDATEVPFTRTITEMEQAYGLQKPEMPKELWNVSEDGPDDRHLLAFDALFDVCENRLRLAKGAYQKLGDMVGYLSASSVLDKIQYRVEARQVDPERGMTILHQLLSKIGEKACLDV